MNSEAIDRIPELTPAQWLARVQRHAEQVQRDDAAEGRREVRERLRPPRCRSVQPVRIVETGEVFPSVVSAAAVFGVKRNAISESLEKGTKCKGFHWVRHGPRIRVAVDDLVIDAGKRPTVS